MRAYFLCFLFYTFVLNFNKVSSNDDDVLCITCGKKWMKEEYDRFRYSLEKKYMCNDHRKSRLDYFCDDLSMKYDFLKKDIKNYYNSASLYLSRSYKKYKSHFLTAFFLCGIYASYSIWKKKLNARYLSLFSSVTEFWMLFLKKNEIIKNFYQKEIRLLLWYKSKENVLNNNNPILNSIITEFESMIFLDKQLCKKYELLKQKIKLYNESWFSKKIDVSDILSDIIINCYHEESSY